MSGRQITEFLVQGLDIGLATLLHTENAAALKLAAASAFDTSHESDRINSLHCLPGFAASSPTQRWAVTDLARIWSEADTQPKPGSLAQYLRSESLVSASDLRELVTKLPKLWNAPCHRGQTPPGSNVTALLILQPGSTNPLQLYEMVHRLPGNHPLSMGFRRHNLPHLQCPKIHFHDDESMLLRKYMTETDEGCLDCGNEVLVRQVQDQCIFYAGDNLTRNDTSLVNSSISHPSSASSFESIQSTPNDQCFTKEYHAFDNCGKAADVSGSVMIEAHFLKVRRTSDM